MTCYLLSLWSLLGYCEDFIFSDGNMISEYVRTEINLDELHILIDSKEVPFFKYPMSLKNTNFMNSTQPPHIHSKPGSGKAGIGIQVVWPTSERTSIKEKKKLVYSPQAFFSLALIKHNLKYHHLIMDYFPNNAMQLINNIKRQVWWFY